ncbi:MAG: LCP family protein [Dermatophilaceae bacterium]
MVEDHVVTDARRNRGVQRGRFSRRLLAAALAVLAIVALVGVGYAAYVWQLVSSQVVQQDLLPDRPVSTDAEAARAGAASDGPASSLPVKLPDTGMNLLVIGSDKEVAGNGWSDAIFLAHITQRRDHVMLVRLPRDLYVTIPGRGQGKLNAAYTQGGAKLLVATIEDLLGIVVDHVAVTGFAGFRGMTDAVGGVDVVVTEPGEWPGYTFVPGTTHMDGEMALAFVRERDDSGGDLSRGTRQQAFLTALLAKSLSADGLINPLRLASFLDAATENITVDTAFTVQEMSSVAFGLRAVKARDVSFLQAPFGGATPGHESVLTVDVPKMRALGDALRTDHLSAPQ